MIYKHGLNIYISEKIIFKGNATVNHCSVIGDTEESQREGHIGNDAKIGKFALIEGNINIGDDFVLDDYCSVYSGAKIGNNVKLLYGKKICANSIIGDNCIIAGNVPERGVLANNVTFMGEVAHNHYNPKSDWDGTDEPSPVIGEGSVIGVNAILLGGITIGKNCYVSTGEILRTNLPDNSVFIKNRVVDINSFRGFIKTRY